MNKPNSAFNKKNLRPSLLDRLIDNEPHINIESEANCYQRIKDMRNSVKRDLIHLLNTRYRIVSTPENSKQVGVSILNYGLPDLATVNIASLEKRQEFTRHLEQLLKEYEPRFKTVKVTYKENSDKSDRTLRFRIDATIYAEETTETIIFDSILEPVSRTVSVEEPGYV